ncbi:hypothetical protein [Bailinhaonella thermotolerans]|uniref:Uncharacterized protein n=1 Tax=Bailinhaonella thermotolerans TaxID=1070861 RepID=A0A3A4A1C7_9ACTN|nr:hypothetical protein [Bailinhaonella thermotolerans]RJL20173.1 hypothetical protein D5H75_39690 [Bailinhaonella thermotolerans]
MTDQVVRDWLTADPDRPAEHGPAGAAERLDRWLADRLPPGDPLTAQPGVRERAVSAGLVPADLAEQTMLLTRAAALLAAHGPDRPGHAELQRGYARRAVQLHEGLAAAEAARPGSTGTPPAALAEQLAAARARLAELDARGAASSTPGAQQDN